MKRNAFVLSVVFIANLASTPSFASCTNTPEASETIVRGRFVRCEDAKFYLEAGGAYRSYEQDLERELARRSSASAARLLELLKDSLLAPNYEARVAVVTVEAHVSIVPWAIGESVQFKDQPRGFHETIRYWWNGSIDQCDGLTENSSIDLWIHSDCCDTFMFGSPVCIIGMNYAEPVPDGMNDVASDLFELL